MKKYQIHLDYKKYSKVNPPLNRFVLPFIRGFGRVVLSFQKSSEKFIVEKYNLPVNNGKIRVTIISPKSVKTASMLVFYHGGGFCYPASFYHFSLAKTLAEEAKIKVAVVSYRLAPKYKFPTQNEDCYFAYQWIRKNAKTLGVNQDEIIVGGDSAGGNLAVGVCLKAKELNQPLPLAQMLLYPALSFDENLESMQLYHDTPMCNTKDIKRYQKLYLDKNQENNEYISPLLAHLNGLPPCYMETAEFDCLRSGAIAFAEKLKACSVAVELINTTGTIHAYDIVQKATITQSLVQRRIAFLKSKTSQN